MADTSHSHSAHGALPVEGDGVNYRGIVWFVVVLVVTTLFCQAIVWGMFEFMAHRLAVSDPARAELAAPAGQLPPAPNLLTDEAGNLREFRAREEKSLSTYGWMDQGAQTVRIPIDRAKALVLARGLPARPTGATATAEPAAPAAKAMPAPTKDRK